ncbi:TPA: replication initiator protein [Salmonella enterica]|nr:replication initiator protein [Salmonella enterica]
MGSCAAPSAKGDDKFITTDYLQQCPGDECKLVLAPGTIRPGQTSSGTVLISVQLQ